MKNTALLFMIWVYEGRARPRTFLWLKMSCGVGVIFEHFSRELKVTKLRIPTLTLAKICLFETIKQVF